MSFLDGPVRGEGAVLLTALSEYGLAFMILREGGFEWMVLRCEGNLRKPVVERGDFWVWRRFSGFPEHAVGERGGSGWVPLYEFV